MSGTTDPAGAPACVSDLSGPEDDDTVEDGGPEGGASETNLPQLPRFTTLQLSGPVGGECLQALTSACAASVRGKWSLTPSGFHLRPAAGPR